MAISLAFTATGLMFAYLLLHVQFQEGKTLNAVLFETLTANWGAGARWFVLVTLVSEAMLLFVAAQAGFLDGPRVLSNMALDRWMPTKFATLSDRLVTQNGILLMGIAAFLMMILSQGRSSSSSCCTASTCSLPSHSRNSAWCVTGGSPRKAFRTAVKKMFVNGLGLLMCSAILALMTVIKFREGGAITVVLTAALVGVALLIHRHYRYKPAACSAASTTSSTSPRPRPAWVTWINQSPNPTATPRPRPPSFWSAATTASPPYALRCAARVRRCVQEFRLRRGRDCLTRGTSKAPMKLSASAVTSWKTCIGSLIT